MNKVWSREHELYARAFGKFISINKFVPTEWLSPDDLVEYTKLTELCSVIK